VDCSSQPRSMTRPLERARRNAAVSCAGLWYSRGLRAFVGACHAAYSHPTGKNTMCHDRNNMACCRLIAEFGQPAAIERECTYGSMRVDFALRYPAGRTTLLEVKNVVGADYPAGGVPEARGSAGVYEVERTPWRRCAIFPHGTGMNNASTCKPAWLCQFLSCCFMYAHVLHALVRSTVP
jgi:Sugar fermentation stimulation protein RE domain